MKLLPLLVLFGLALGCAKDDPDSKVTAGHSETASVAKAGWKEMETSGIKISFPPTWTALDLTKGDFEKMIEAVAKDNPQGEKMAQVAKQAAASGMVKLMVFDTASASADFVNNANLIVTPMPGGATLDQALEANKAQLQPMVVQGTTVDASKVNLPSGEAGRIRSVLMAPGGQRYVALAYLIPHGGQLYVFTFSAKEGQEKEYDANAMETLKTLSFVD